MKVKIAVPTLFLMFVAALGLTIYAGQTTSSTTTTTSTPPAPSLTGLQTALDLTAAQVSQQAAQVFETQVDNLH